jgi:hypothetical protein
MLGQKTKEAAMNKLKIERGASRIKRAKLQSSIDQSIANDIELMAEWSDNETHYIVNELLRYALAQSEEFQKHKAQRATNPLRSDVVSEPASLKEKASANPTSKLDTAPAGTITRA